MRFNGTTVPTHRDDTYDTSEVSRYKSSGGSDIEVEALDVTENGIYTAPDGKAYSSVNVNVAGGGSSDFSTATMTISGFPSGVGGGVGICGFVEIDDGALKPISLSINYQNGTYVVVLYQGMSYVYCSDSITVSGDAEYDGEEIITATGDFTISPLL